MTGTIKHLLNDKGCGFIKGQNGTEYFFHRSALKNADFDTLEMGREVTFEDVDTPKGPRAEDVFV